MTIILIIECFSLLLLFLCSAFFSSAETALFSLNPLHVQRIRKFHPAAGERIEHMLVQPTKLLATILIGNTIVNVTAAGIGYVIVGHLFPVHAEIISIPVMTILLLVLGEITPKRLAISRSEKLSTIYAPVLSSLITATTPLRAIMEKTTHLLRHEVTPGRKPLSEDEFLSVVDVSEEEGVLDEEEHSIVNGIIGLQEKQASDIMTPRVDIIGIDLDDPPEERELIARTNMFRYLPVYRESLDQPEGFVDVLKFMLSSDHNFDAALIEPFFTPETAPLDHLLSSFRAEKRHIAFVTDEYGGTAGIVTRGDILEEIIDDVDHEFRPEIISIQEMGENRWLVDGGTSLDDIEYETGMRLEAEGVDRIAGWVIAQAEHIPKTGEIVEAQLCKATVTRVKKQRVILVMLEKQKRTYTEPIDF